MREIHSAILLTCTGRKQVKPDVCFKRLSGGLSIKIFITVSRLGTLADYTQHELLKNIQTMFSRPQPHKTVKLYLFLRTKTKNKR